MQDSLFILDLKVVNIVFLSITFFMLVFTLLINIFLKERPLYYYGLYLIFIFFFGFRFTDFAEQIAQSLDLSTIEFLRYTDITFGAGFSGFHYLFLITFVDLKTHLSFHYKILKTLVISLFFFILVDWFLLFGLQSLEYSKSFEFFSVSIASFTVLYIFRLLFKINTKYANTLRISYGLIFTGVLTVVIFDFILGNRWIIQSSEKSYLEPIHVLDNFWMLEISLICEYGVFIYLFVLQSIETYKEKAILERDFRYQQQESKSLKEIMQFKSQMVTTISHEFRTPLTLILGLSKKLLKYNFDNSKEDLQMIYDKGEDILELVDSISELDTNKNKELNMTQNDVVSFISYIVKPFKSIATESKKKLKLKVDRNMILMDFDQQKLKIILHNLLNNALKFTDANDHINVEISENIVENQRKLHIKISDTGIGIPKNKLDIVFDAFVQIENGRRNYGGSGIGLATVKTYVNQLGGSIEVQSEPKLGTSFLINLPIHNQSPLGSTEEWAHVETPSSYSEIVKGNGKPQGTTKPTILVTDDNKEIVHFVRDILSDFTLVCKYDGDSAIQFALNNPPDLIICDVMMPQMDGYEVCQKLKADIRTSHIPFIFLTAKIGEHNKIMGLARGAQAYIQKPFQEEELKLTVRNLLQITKERKTLFSEHIGEIINLELEKLDIEFLQSLDEYLENNMVNKISQDDLCKHLLVSRMTLNRKIHALTAESPSQYILKFRLKKGAKLLIVTRDKLKYIAQQIGLSESRFSYSFKVHFGMTPSQYRRLQSQEISNN